MPTAKVHDGELHFIERGAGPVLLLAHGFPLDHTMWHAQIDELSAARRVIAPDLRGFGRSSILPGLATMPRMADDLAQLLDQLEIREPIAFGGLSMGGYVAWQFALRYRERLASLILCDTKAVGDTPEAAANRNAVATRVLKEGPGFLAESLPAKLFSPQTIAASSPLIEETKRVILKTNPQGIAAASRGMAQRPDVTRHLGQFDLPVLVLCGEDDAISTTQEMRGFSQLLPQASYVEIAGAGHMAPLEKPREVNAAIRRFLHA